MPTLQLHISPPQPAARHAALAQRLTALTASTLGKRADVTAVLIEELPAGRWSVGGVPVQRPTARLEICITQGTNTAEEKAAFVGAAWNELEAQLGQGGGLEPASYVVVRDVPATDWGYGGQTQRSRQRLRAAAAHASDALTAQAK